MSIALMQSQIRRALKKSRLNGFEVAKIVLSEFWANEHVQDLILSESEMNSLVNNLTLSDEIDDYGNWYKAYRAIVEVNNTARMVSLAAQKLLTEVNTAIERLIDHYLLMVRFRLMVPAIVTESEYHDLKTEQRKQLLKEKYSLGFILYRRANTINIQHTDEEFDDLESLLEEGQQKAAALFRQASREIYDLVKKGDLSLSHRKEALTLLERIQNKKTDEELLAMMETVLYKEPSKKMEEPEPLLDRSTATGEALFTANLPEWVTWISEYKHNLEGYPPHQVAVIQNPDKEQVDERGYFKNQGPFAGFFPQGSLSIDCLHNMAPNLCPSIEALLLEAKQELAYFLFCKSLLEILSDVTGVPFHEDVEREERRIIAALARVKGNLDKAGMRGEGNEEWHVGVAGALDIDNLKPSPELEKFFRKRLNEPLETDKWLQDCRSHGLKEILRKLSPAEIERYWLSNEQLGKKAKKRVAAILAELKREAEKQQPDPHLAK